VTNRAILAFHAAWDFGRNGRTVTNPGATLMLYSMYPPPIQKWLDSRGGLTPRTVFLRGKQLQEMYRPCSRRLAASSVARTQERAAFEQQPE
jgi:hypothetical protein